MCSYTYLQAFSPACIRRSTSTSECLSSKVHKATHLLDLLTIQHDVQLLCLMSNPHHFCLVQAHYQSVIMFLLIISITMINGKELRALPCLKPILTENSSDNPDPTTTFPFVLSYIASTILASASVLPSISLLPSPSL